MSPGYPDYADRGPSWARRIPSHWSVKPLMSVGREPRRSNRGMVEDNLLSLSFGRIVRKDIDTQEGLLPESFETYQVVEPNDMIFRFTDLQNDKRSLRSARTPERGIITSAYMAFTPERIDPHYFEHLMRAYDSTKVFYGLGGGLRQSLKFADVRRLPVLVPTSAEQGAIADFLDRETAKIDALIDKLSHLSSLLQERRGSIATNLVDPDDLAASGQRLKHHLASVRQGWSPQCNNWPADEASWAVLKAGCANGGRFRPEENKELPDDLEPRPDTVVQEGDLIVSRANTRELVGAAAAVHGRHPRLMLSDKLYAFRMRPTASVEFVASALGTRRYRDLIELEATGASPSMQNITQETVRNLPMGLPSRTQQDAIVSAINTETAKIDALIAKAEEFVALARERRAALITAAVTGQLDVRAAHRDALGYDLAAPLTDDETSWLDGNCESCGDLGTAADRPVT